MLENVISISATVNTVTQNYSYELDELPDGNSSIYLEATSTADAMDKLLHTRKRGVRNANFRGTNRAKVTFQKGHTVAGYDPETTVRSISHITTEVVTPVGVSRDIVEELVNKKIAYMQTSEFIDSIVLGCQR